MHFKAPDAPTLEEEMQRFLTWFNQEHQLDPVLKAGMAHLWFVTLHPFDDGNGRVARALTGMQLARAEKSSQRYYSMSAHIRQERTAYCAILEKTQKGPLDITPWLEWFLTCLHSALRLAEAKLETVMERARFWDVHAATPMNERQRLLITRLHEGFTGKLTSSKWAKIAKCSQDTAGRDILDLIQKGILVKAPGGGRSTSNAVVTPANR
ncbi:Fic family protein [Pontibacter rugosus]|uniref:Fic family protein n=1 Tax=Pontibacter rugosus TaxID=1745966 RepID=A0ABW3SKR2_9BACT